MSREPKRDRPGKDRPEIWASGGQRPPFDLRALGRAALYLSRTVAAPVHAWAARGLRRGAERVRDGWGRVPADRLGRAARFVPSHLRVAGWIRNLAATLSHASASADPDVKRGNALVAEIAPHLWDEVAKPHQTAPESPPELPPEPAAMPGAIAPVVLPEPTSPPPQDDPLAAIRADMAVTPVPRALHPSGPDLPPAPPGPVADGAIQVTGYLIGWASVIVALPIGLARALWLWASGQDLKTIGPED